MVHVVIKQFNMKISRRGGSYPPGVTKRPHVYFQGRYIREFFVMAPPFYSGRMLKCLMTTSPFLSSTAIYFMACGILIQNNGCVQLHQMAFEPQIQTQNLVTP
jgi:hypothetical protein